MVESIVTTINQLNIFSAVAYQAIACRYRSLYSKYARVIDIVNDRFIECYAGICVYGWPLCDDALVSIPDNREINLIILAASPEINSRPRSREVFKGNIEAVALEIYTGAVIFFAIYFQCAIHN